MKKLWEFFTFNPKTLDNTVRAGMVIGLIGIIGYPYFMVGTSRGKLLFFLIVIAAAAYISGFFLGILFGIPKRNNNPANATADYSLSNNLVDISDWLTKIIIGLGLVEIKTIPAHLQSIGDYVQNSVMPGEKSLRIFVVACIVYFVIYGLYYGYTYMRLFLSCEFKKSDNELLSPLEKLTKQGEILAQQDTSPEKLDDLTKVNAAEYGRILRTTKLESEYTFEDWYYKAVDAYAKTEYNKVIAYLSDALIKDQGRKNPSIPDVYHYLGFSYGALGIYDKSKEFYELLINNYKNYGDLANVYYNLGITLSELGQDEKAIEMYEKALGIDPTQDSAEYNKACSYALLGNKEKMLASLALAISRTPADKNRARSDEDFKRFKEDEDFKKLVAE